MRRILDAFAEYERAMIRARTKAALQALAAQGVKLGPPCYGRTDDERALVARAVQLREQGLTLAAWCASSPDSALDPRLADLVEQAVARGFVRAMSERTGRTHTSIVHADPIAQEERAAILRALNDERDETLAARLGLSVSQLAAVRGMKARAPRLTDEQRARLGLAPRQMQLPVGDERRTAERREPPAPPEPGASTIKVRQTKRGGNILVADERTAERREGKPRGSKPRSTLGGDA
jgi:hypothetical protein